MAVSYVCGTTLTVAGTQLVNTTVSVSGGSDLRMSESIPIASNNLVAFTCDVSQLKAIVIKSDVAITIYTNAASTGSPAQTIAVSAGVPIAWNSSSGLTNPLTTDITALYITNAAASVAALEIYKLEDPTV